MMAYISEPGISPQAIETALRALSLRDEAIPFLVAAPAMLLVEYLQDEGYLPVLFTLY